MSLRRYFEHCRIIHAAENSPILLRASVTGATVYRVIHVTCTAETTFELQTKSNEKNRLIQKLYDFKVWKQNMVC